MATQVAASPTTANRIPQLPAELALCIVLDASPTPPQWIESVLAYITAILAELSAPYFARDKVAPNVSDGFLAKSPQLP